MSRFPVQVAAGLFVLVAGLTVVYVVVVAPVPEPRPAAQQFVPSSTPAQLVEVTPPTLVGVDPAVQRVLYSTGQAEAFSAYELTRLPPEVARVLVSSGTTIIVPGGAGGGR